jgi:hypothetical protein
VPWVIGADDSIDEALRTMIDNKVRRQPPITRLNNLLGSYI